MSSVPFKYSTHTWQHSTRDLLDTSNLPAFQPWAATGSVDWRSAAAVSIPSTRARSSFQKKAFESKPLSSTALQTAHPLRLVAFHEWQGQAGYYLCKSPHQVHGPTHHRIGPVLRGPNLPRADSQIVLSHSETICLHPQCTLLSRLLLLRTSCPRLRLILFDYRTGCRIRFELVNNASSPRLHVMIM